MKKQVHLTSLFITFFIIIQAGFPLGLADEESNPAVKSLYGTQPPPSLFITKIRDGNELTVTIENLGEKTQNDITLTVDHSDGFLCWIPQKQFQIDTIPAKNTKTLTVTLFGLGIGKITNYPRITLSVFSKTSISINKSVTIRLVGSSITILGEFFNSPRSYPGYTLFSPEYSTYTFLINNDAEIVHQWKSNHIQGLPVYLDEQGNLIRGCSKLDNPLFLSGGFTGRVEIRDWNDSLTWEFDYSTDRYCLHHDIEPLPNGNILMISWEYKTSQEAINEGRDPNKIQQNGLWPDKIIEVKPIGQSEYEIVWEWHVWDHLIQDFDSSKNNYGKVNAHPEKIDINFGNVQSDWTHINSIDYHPGLDQILLSVHNFNEIWIIDHSTTTEEARGSTGGHHGKGGDLLYRWGNPASYQMGSKQDQQLFGQHDCRWITSDCPGAGNILVFNNGQGRPDGSYSSIDEIRPPLINGAYFRTPDTPFEPDRPLWRYVSTPPFAFFSGHISGTQRLPDGNSLICSGDDGTFFEVTREGHTVWSYVNTFLDAFNNHCFKIQRYGLDYPGILLNS